MGAKKKVCMLRLVPVKTLQGVLATQWLEARVHRKFRGQPAHVKGYEESILAFVQWKGQSLQRSSFSVTQLNIIIFAAGPARRDSITWMQELAKQTGRWSLGLIVGLRAISPRYLITFQPCEHLTLTSVHSDLAGPGTGGACCFCGRGGRRERDERLGRHSGPLSPSWPPPHLACAPGVQPHSHVPLPSHMSPPGGGAVGYVLFDARHVPLTRVMSRLRRRGWRRRLRRCAATRPGSPRSPAGA